MGHAYERPRGAQVRRASGDAGPDGSEDAADDGADAWVWDRAPHRADERRPAFLNYGTLYPQLLKLEQESYISSEWGVSDNNRKAKFYTLTRAGRRQAERQANDWRQTAAFSPASWSRRKGGREALACSDPPARRRVHAQTRPLASSTPSSTVTFSSTSTSTFDPRYAPAEARRLALAELGGRQQARERHRDRHGLPFLDQLSQDTRFGLRLFARNPGFSLLTIATLTIGLGVNILVFSIGYPIVATPLPGADSDRLVRVFENDNSNVIFANYLEYRDRNRTLSGLTATRTEGFSLRTGGGVEHATGLVVTGDYFGVLGVGTALGRTLTPADDRPDSPAVVVLSHGTWTRQFGSDPAIVGRVLSINARPFTVVGVALEQFPGTSLPAVPELYATWHGAG